jgi:hypothetical protein
LNIDIQFNKIEALTKTEEGIEFDTLKDGVVMTEEFENSGVKFRAFYLICTIPIPNVNA